MILTPRKPYAGPCRKLILGLDIGTTYSGISYALLEPDQIPEIKGVTRFPAQEHVGGDSKIPSVLYYDKNGAVRAAGAETLREELIEQAEDEEWTKIEWFKLHLRPKRVNTRHMKRLPLPPNKTIVGVYADFLKYLFSCAETYIKETHADGESLWESVKDEIDYVITHPNGWEGSQRARLRSAATEAGLIPETNDGRMVVQFLSEGEASLHFCAQNGLGSKIVETGNGVIIVDAGGGTIDVSAFAANSTNGFEEISVAQCHFQGSVFVTRRATAFLEDKFSETKFANDVPHMAAVFDRTTKLRFRSEKEQAYIKFGGVRDKDPELNVRAGQLTLKGTEVADFFRPSVDAIIEAILTQHKNSHKPISNVFLVGGFAASDFLFSTLHDALQSLELTISRPDAHVNKAVADGAVSFYLDRLVSVRVARFDYGTDCCARYDPTTMSSRAHLVYQDFKGKSRVPGMFSIILAKNTQVSETQCFSHSYSQEAGKESDLDQCTVPIRSYHGYVDPCPEWMDEDTDNFSTHCTISGDLSAVPKPVKQGPKSAYHQIRFNVNISFGPVEMSAHLTWNENGETKRGPAVVIYEDELEDDSEDEDDLDLN